MVAMSLYTIKERNRRAFWQGFRWGAAFCFFTVALVIWSALR